MLSLAGSLFSTTGGRHACQGHQAGSGFASGCGRPGRGRVAGGRGAGLAGACPERACPAVLRALRVPGLARPTDDPDVASGRHATLIALQGSSEWSVKSSASKLSKTSALPLFVSFHSQRDRSGLASCVRKKQGPFLFSSGCRTGLS